MGGGENAWARHGTQRWIDDGGDAGARSGVGEGGGGVTEWAVQENLPKLVHGCLSFFVGQRRAAKHKSKTHIFRKWKKKTSEGIRCRKERRKDTLTRTPTNWHLYPRKRVAAPPHIHTLKLVGERERERGGWAGTKGSHTESASG